MCILRDSLKWIAFRSYLFAPTDWEMNEYDIHGNQIFLIPFYTSPLTGKSQNSGCNALG